MLFALMCVWERLRSILITKFIRGITILLFTSVLKGLFLFSLSTSHDVCVHISHPFIEEVEYHTPSPFQIVITSPPKLQLTLTAMTGQFSAAQGHGMMVHCSVISRILPV